MHEHIITFITDPTVFSAAGHVPTESLTDWAKSQATQIKDTALVIAGAAFVVGGLVIAVIKKFRIGALVGMLLSFGVAAWIILGGGISWVQGGVTEQVNSSAGFTVQQPAVISAGPIGQQPANARV